MIGNWHRYSLVIVLLGSLLSACLLAQNNRISNRLTADQLLTSLRSIKNPSPHPAVIDESNQDVKCGFGIHAQIVNRINEFSEDQRAELSGLMIADVMQSDTIAGHFRIFYDTTGINEPALIDVHNQRIPGTAKAYIQLVAQIFNHVWEVEIDQMGYSAPPLSNGQQFYNIFVTNMGDYGVPNFDETTRINPGQNPPLYYSSISIDNDFQEDYFYTHGINALEVTAAHEFHHAIQIGAYGYWESDLYAHELTSTWFEDVVYTEVNDYYQYLPVFFGEQNLAIGFSQGLSFNSNAYQGYERCVFAHCIAKIYGNDIIKDIWTGMQTLPFLESTDAALVKRGSNLQSTFTDFTRWNYYTADRADTINFYSEGNHYPRFQPLQKIQYFNTTAITSGTVEPLSSSMYEFDLQDDTVTAVIANVDTSSAMNRNTTPQNIEVILSSGLVGKISVADFSLWRWFFIPSSTKKVVPPMDAAPNPFILSTKPWLKLPINQDGASTAEVYFYTSSFQLVYSGSLKVSNEDGFRAIVVPTSEVRSKLSSGIYFVFAKTTSNDYKWKVAVIR